jgi:uncharacterized protein YjbI with pentapeptide repeats
MIARLMGGSVMQMIPDRTPVQLIMFGTLLFSLILSVIGRRLLRSGDSVRQNLGVSLLSGSVITLAVFFLQVMLTVVSDEQQKVEQQQREAEQKLEQQQREVENFRLTIAVSGTLRGFTPGKYSIAGLILNGKDMTGAYLRNQDLKGSQFQDTILAQADLVRADARNANFLNADFFNASVDETDFRGADLRFAKFEGASVSAGAKFTGAKVNSHTCWPQWFFDHGLQEAGLKPIKNPRDPADQANPLGHVCREGEHRESGPPE